MMILKEKITSLVIVSIMVLGTVTIFVPEKASGIINADGTIGYTIFKPPYDKCYNQTLKGVFGTAGAEYLCDKQSGYIAAYSYAASPIPYSYSSCQAGQGINFCIGQAKSLSFDIEFIYLGGTEAWGLGTFPSTFTRCYIDSNSDGDYDDVISKDIHSLLSWSNVVNQIRSFISFLDNPLGYTIEGSMRAFYTMVTAEQLTADQLYNIFAEGENEVTHLRFNYTFPPGCHTIFTGFDVGGGTSFIPCNFKSLMVGQVNKITISGIDPPGKPSIEGAHIADLGESLEFCFKSFDSNGDNIRYKIDWGDGTIEPWTGFFPSNACCNKSHHYSNIGQYHITVQAQDSDFDGSKIARHTIAIVDENVIMGIKPAEQKIYQNENFEISIYADSGGFSILGISADLYYNQSVFTVKNITPGNIFESRFYVSSNFSVENGHIYYEIASIPFIYPPLPTRGLLLSIEFEVIGGIAGSTYVFEGGGNLKDQFSNTLLNLSSNDAYVEILGAEEPEYVYMELSPSWQTILQGESFSINVSLYPNDNIAGVQFDLAFDSSKITANEIIIGDFFENYSSYFNAGNINNIKGTITGVYNVITTPEASVTTPGTIATINFTANDYDDISYLNLSNIIIGGPEGSTVPIISRNAIIEISNPSDINKDERINILDLIIIGQHWSETGSPGWISADVNCDGLINILDMILVGQHWTG